MNHKTISQTNWLGYGDASVNVWSGIWQGMNISFLKQTKHKIKEEIFQEGYVTMRGSYEPNTHRISFGPFHVNQDQMLDIMDCDNTTFGSINNENAEWGSGWWHIEGQIQVRGLLGQIQRLGITIRTKNLLESEPVVLEVVGVKSVCLILFIQNIIGLYGTSARGFSTWLKRSYQELSQKICNTSSTSGYRMKGWA